MLVFRESCLQYFRRRLSEGWKCVSLEGYKAVLLSPWGFKRKIDLRNDVETLRPSGAGAETNCDIGGTVPAATNWQSVDEAIADENTTYVVAPGSGWFRDLYNLPAHSVGIGTINKITLYFRVKTDGWADVYGAIRSDTTVTETALKDPAADFGANNWGTYTKEWATNPADAGAWEWADIDALQIGVNLQGDPANRGTVLAYCTQVYVEVDYTPGWVGKISGVTNPAKVMGVAVADIAEVKGVA